MNRSIRHITLVVLFLAIFFNLTACSYDLPDDPKDGPIRTLYASGIVDGTSWEVRGINGTLIIDGNGPMANFEHSAPWSRYSYSKIIIKDGITSIGDHAFSYACVSGDFTIPDQITAIGDHAFVDSGLQSISIPPSVTFIGERPFAYCYGLRSINVDDANPVFSSRDGVLFTKDGEELIAFPWGKSDNSYTIPEGTRTIGAFAFSGCMLKEVVFPNTIEAIDGYAFAYCDNLASLALPDGVSKIDSNAFRSCFKLSSVVLPQSLTQIEDGVFGSCRKLETVVFPQKLVSIGDGAFHYCRAMTELSLPDSLETIGANAFSYCESLTELHLPDTLSEIGRQAFCYCDGLEQITIPSNVHYIGGGAFSSYEKLTDIYLAEGNQSYAIIDHALYSPDGKTLYCYPSGREEQSFVMLEHTTEIADYAFYGCDSLTDIRLSDCVSKIGEGAFFGCNIRHIDLPDTLTGIGDEAFAYCRELESIDIPSGVRSIGRGAFCECRKLRQIDLPEGISVIEASTFHWCSNLRRIGIPETVKRIDRDAFNGCRALTAVQLPEGVESIGDEVFMNSCLELKVFIPVSTLSIGKYNFLDNIFYEGTESQWKKISTESCSIVSSPNILFNCSITEFED